MLDQRTGDVKEALQKIGNKPITELAFAHADGLCNH